MPTDIAIRTMTAGDIEAIVELQQLAVRRAGRGVYGFFALEAWACLCTAKVIRDWMREREYAGYVAVRAGRPIGYAARIGSRIKSLYVHPDYMRRGLGSQLMQLLEDTAADEGRRELSLRSSLVAKSFYERWGYTVIETICIPFPEGFDVECVEMAKKAGVSGEPDPSCTDDPSCKDDPAGRRFPFKSSA